jgi:DNA-binding NarL/FixJ family response regulator
MTEARAKILVVDDHPVVRKGLSTFLSNEPDLEVVGTAASGEEAIAMVAEAEPDLVLMDLSMPGMGGIEATRRLVETNPSIRVVMLTSFGGHERMVEALKSGAVGYVVKDTVPAEMLRALRSVIQGGTEAHAEDD